MQSMSSQIIHYGLDIYRIYVYLFDFYTVNNYHLPNQVNHIIVRCVILQLYQEKVTNCSSKLNEKVTRTKKAINKPNPTYKIYYRKYIFLKQLKSIYEIKEKMVT